MTFPVSLSFSGGGDESNPVVWTADSLGMPLLTRKKVPIYEPLYLSVEIYPTNFEVMADQYATVTVNGTVVDAHCTPNESCGTEWFSCVSEFDVTRYRQEELGGSLTVEVSLTGVNSGPCDYLNYPLYTRMFLRETLPTGEPTMMPSSEPTGQPSRRPSGEPSHQPSGEPSGQPSGQPSGEPSSAPSIQSTNQPTGMPTASPTLVFPLTYESEIGGVDSVIFHVSQVGFANRSVPKYLSVGVWPTDFADKADQWATVKINGLVVVPFCTPQSSCGRRFFYCMLQEDIHSYVNSSLGGSFSVEVTTTGVTSGPCDHVGYPLYAHLHFTENKPTKPESLSIWIFVGICIGIALILLVVLWYLYYSKLQTDRGNFLPTKIDVEMGTDNNDAADDDEIPYEDKLRIKPSRSEMYLRNLSRITPVDESAAKFSTLLSPDFRQKPGTDAGSGSSRSRMTAGVGLDLPKSRDPPPLKTKHSHLHISRTVDGMSIIDSLDS
jgi:hypothetical protein